MPQSKPGAKENKSPLLYHPSIFRYTCKGRLNLVSREPTTGVCKGIQSQLEHVDHWRLTTRDEAVKVFQQKSEAPTGGVQHQGDTSAPTAAHSLEVANISNVLVYPQEKNASEEEMKKEEMKKEDWSCYGSTEIDLLVLRPQNSKQETIAAVSPYCSPGMTIRDISDPALGRDRTSTIRLGVVEIVYQSSIVDEEDESHSREASKMTSSQSREKKKQDTLPLSTRLLSSSSNILKSMKINAQLVYQASQENFPQRSYSSGMRIVKEFESTWTRTTTLMKKVAFWDWSDDGSSDGSKKR
jgi:hypothetical protein